MDLPVNIYLFQACYEIFSKPCNNQNSFRPSVGGDVTITLTMIIVFMNNKYLCMIVTCLYEMIRIAYVLNTWLVQCYTAAGSIERFRDDK